MSAVHSFPARSLNSVTGSDRSNPLKEPLQLSTAHRMLQLANRLGFDLTHAFSSHLEDAPHFLQSVRVTVTQTIPQLDNLTLTVGQRLQNNVNLVLQLLLDILDCFTEDL